MSHPPTPPPFSASPTSQETDFFLFCQASYIHRGNMSGVCALSRPAQPNLPKGNKKKGIVGTFAVSFCNTIPVFVFPFNLRESSREVFFFFSDAVYRCCLLSPWRHGSEKSCSTNRRKKCISGAIRHFEKHLDHNRVHL